MDIMIFAGAVLLGCLINFIKECDTRSVARIAGIYIFIALLSFVYGSIRCFFGINDADLLKAVGIFLQITNIIAHATLGYLVAYLALNIRQVTNPDENAGLRSIIRLTLWGITISIANSFLSATLGKAINMPYMISFFKQSGYAIWFLYFIMSVEALGGLGILLHFKLKTGPLAAAGLMLIMLGAIYTHLHNRDPFSDSYAAIIQLINLCIIHILYFFEKYINQHRPVTPIYIV